MLFYVGYFWLFIDKNREVCINVYVLYCYVFNNCIFLRINVCYNVFVVLCLVLVNILF